jgi:hypothetical protein
MNIVIFASDAKALSSLNGIIHECHRQGIKFFAMITQSTTLKHPTLQQGFFQILSNVERKDVVKSDTLGIHLPFKPDWLIVNRERWDPETHIIQEFKKKFKCKVGLVEPNSWILNGAESRLETYSKNRFIDLIDIFFIGSQHGINQQRIAGFTGNLVAVGNPKYDSNFDVQPNHLEYLKQQYKVKEDTNKHLLFSLVNSHRPKLNKILTSYDNNSDIQTFYKPYPNEPFDPKFSNDFKPSFFLSNTQPILDEKHVWGMFEICDTHVGTMSSIVHASLLKGKKYIDHSLDLNLPEEYLDFSNVFKDGGPGLENNKSMWMRSFGFTTESQLRDLLPNEFRDQTERLNNKVWDNLNNPDILLTLFDDYNDGNASKRIINELQK